MSPKTAEISVITVVLNDKIGLERTIASIQRQKSLAIEHLIIDGGSTDGSSELAFQFSSVSVASKPDGGIYPAMHRGAKYATGEFIIFCNAGDALFGDEYLSAAVTQLRKQKALWGFGPIIEYTERKTFAWVPAPTKLGVKEIISRKIFVPFPSFVIERKLYLDLGGLTDQFKIAGDFELICKAANYAVPAIFREPIALFAAGGISYVKADKAWREEIAIREKLNNLNFLKRCKEWVRFVFRFIRWKTGKLLDFIQSLFPAKIASWREYRAKPIPRVYEKFLIE